MTAFPYTDDGRAYIAGPMRGHRRFNFDAFDQCAASLRRWGWQVRSPAEHDRECGFDPDTDTLEDFDLGAAMRWDINSICWADTVVTLAGWRHSQGANFEVAIAVAVGNQILGWDGTQLAPVEHTPLVGVRP